jgi:hypothetical protein
VTLEDGFAEEKDKAQDIPEGHGGAEARGEGLDKGELLAIVEAAEDGIDEGGDRELGSDEQAEAEGGDEVQDHGGCLLFAFWDKTRGGRKLTQRLVLTKLSVQRADLDGGFEEGDFAVPH